MTKTFTQDDIIRYVYKETTPDENYDIELALCQDNDLYHIYQQVRSLFKKLDTLQYTPPERSIQHILNYSRSTLPMASCQAVED